jgi:hypothetical protein
LWWENSSAQGKSGEGLTHKMAQRLPGRLKVLLESFLKAWHTDSRSALDVLNPNHNEAQSSIKWCRDEEPTGPTRVPQVMQTISLGAFYNSRLCALLFFGATTPDFSFSGITPQALEPITTTLADVQAHIRTLITLSTILLGHSLE